MGNVHTNSIIFSKANALNGFRQELGTKSVWYIANILYNDAYTLVKEMMICNFKYSIVIYFMKLFRSRYVQTCFDFFFNPADQKSAGQKPL